MSYITIILLIGLLIIAHEVGHFVAAHYLKIPVARFSIGFGPKLFRFRRKGTEYVLSLLPLGGYVAPRIESREEFHAIPWRKRLLFSLGGPAANIVLALFCFALLNMLSAPSLYAMVIQPFIQTATSLYQLVATLPTLFHHHDRLSGIVGIVVQGGQFTDLNVVKTIRFSIFLNINLAVLNLLPLPPLDGGNIALYLFEKIHPRALRLHAPLALTGWILLVGLMVYATVLDIGRYSTGLFT